MTSPTSIHLLSLPTEMRLHIYKQFFDEVYLGWSAELTALLCTCKKIYSEVELEVIRMTMDFWSMVTDKLKEGRGETLIISRPKNLGECFNCTISRQKTLRMFVKKDPLTYVKYIRFSCLTIASIVEDGCTASEYDHSRGAYSLANDIARYSYWESVPHYKRLVLDWSNYPEEESPANRSILNNAHFVLCKNEAWIMKELRDQERKVIGVAFERNPKYERIRELRRVERKAKERAKGEAV